MKEHYVTFEQAVKLKELGFDWRCAQYYTNDYMNDDPEDVTREVILRLDYPYNHNKVIGRWTAPRLDQAQAWLREVKGMDIDIPPVLKVCPEKAKTYNSYLCYFSKSKVGYMNNYDRIGEGYSNYESALSAGITEALKLLEERK